MYPAVGIHCSDVLFSAFGFIFLSFFIISITYRLSTFSVFPISRYRTDIAYGQHAAYVLNSFIVNLMAAASCGFGSMMRMALGSVVREFVLRKPAPSSVLAHCELLASYWSIELLGETCTCFD